MLFTRHWPKICDLCPKCLHYLREKKTYACEETYAREDICFPLRHLIW